MLIRDYSILLEPGVLTGLSRRTRMLATGRLYSSRSVVERFEQGLSIFESISYRTVRIGSWQVFLMSIYIEYYLLLRAPCSTSLLSVIYDRSLILGTKYILLYTRPA